MADGWLHVAAAVVEDGQGRVFLARRPTHLHQGGLWEFPGGKLESGETALEGLRRELHEEIGIEIIRAIPLIQVRHAYPDRKVLLDVWRVTAFSGLPHGREGQETAWVAQEELPLRDFPAANIPVVTAACLPQHYLITPEPGAEPEWGGFVEHLGQRLEAGIRLFQLRAKDLSERELEALARRIVPLAHRHRARVLINGSPELVLRTGADGLHSSATALSTCKKRPVSNECWWAASCHSLEELRRAEELGVDFAVLSPVKPTESHPGVPLLGWDGFSALSEQAALPVFALGGMNFNDLGAAQHAGAQGIAGISAFWSPADASLLEVEQ